MTSRKTAAAGRKEFGQHDTLAALTAGLAQRYEPAPSEPGRAATAESNVVAAGEKSERTPSASNSRRDGMVVRSWYLSAETVEALNSTVNELFHDLRGAIPKHAIIAELITAGIAQSEDVRATLQQAPQE